MKGQHRIVANESQREHALQDVLDRSMPFLIKLEDPVKAKTTRQIRYAHSLCNALAAYCQALPEAAKRDLKAAHGVVVVCTSLVTGDRSVRLASFSDYSKQEMMGFISATEAHLDERQIPYVNSLQESNDE